MHLEWIFAALMIGYFTGSISFSRLVTRAFAPQVDLTQVKMQDAGTGEDYHLTNVGATTASMVLGPKFGLLIAALDILKGFLPTLIVRLLLPDQPYFLFTAGAVVGGHIWTAFHQFRGGGGLSPALGVFLAIDPVGILAANVIAMFLGFFVLREYLVAMMAGTWIMIPWLWIATGRWEFGLFAFLVNVMLVLAIIPDVSRYLRARKMGVIDNDMSMDRIPMGRMMNQMMERMGLSKKRPSDSTSQKNQKES
jgi:acyl phosphate:glycerol-3-phosphate acyltransferase